MPLTASGLGLPVTGGPPQGAYELRPAHGETRAALDMERVGEVLGVVEELVQEGVTMSVVTHGMGCAGQVGERVGCMAAGADQGSDATKASGTQTRLAR